MKEVSLSGDALKKGMLCLTDHAKLFHGMKPDQMVAVAKAAGLGKLLPFDKKKMSLLVYTLRYVKSNPILIPMIKEVKLGQDGKVLIIAGNVKQSDLDKGVKIITPNSELTRIGDMLKRGL